MNRREFVSAFGVVVTMARSAHFHAQSSTTESNGRIIFSSAPSLAERIRTGKITAVQVLDAHLEHIQAHNSTLHAIVTLDSSRARQRAKDADDALARGKLWGPLHGVPITLEDAHATADIRSTWGGFPALKDYVPPADGTVAARLKSAGAIILGKTHGPNIWPDSVFDRTNNPWNIEHSPGASSSGPGAALAAGLTPLDVGLDTLGSVINPAHDCGVYGMRPTDHRVGLTGSTFIDKTRKWRVMMVPGPMGRSLEDLELALRILSGSDASDAEVPPVGWRESQRPMLKDLRVAWTPSFGGLLVASEIQAGIAGLARKLADAGATVSERLPDMDLTASAALAYRLFDTVAAADGQSASTLSDYFELLQARDGYIAAWDRFLRDWDVFVCPAGPITAERHGQQEFAVDGTVLRSDKFPALDVVHTLSPITGCPAVVMPLGVDRGGLPFGVQLMGPRWNDERLLAVAKVVAGLTEGFHRPPGF
jgi:amidase